MITLEKLRVALRHRQPWTALDELVRVEQVAGRKVKEIHDELQSLVEPVRAMDNPPEEADDAMMDTLDALAGNCRLEDRYVDPPNTALPNEEEIAKLPRWARVAFAARCARRVMPLFVWRWPLSPARHVAAVAQAIEIAEGSAAAAVPQETAASAAQLAELAAWEAVANGNANAAVAASNAASAVVMGPNSAALVLSSVSAAVAAIDFLVKGEPGSQAKRALGGDYEHIARLSAGQQWTDETPVSPDRFGPLWPDGPPAEWPADVDIPQQDVQLLALQPVVGGTLPGATG